MIVLFAALLFAVFSVSTATAWTTMNLPGTWDGFNAADTSGPFRMNKVSPPATPSGVDWYTNVMFVTASGGDVTGGNYQFKLAPNGSFGTNWGGGATVTIDSVTSLGLVGANATITLSNGLYYSFRTLNPPANSSAVLAVLKTSARPVTVTRSSQSPVVPRTNDTVAVYIALGASKSPEEHIFVRWTTNGFAMAAFVEASGSGTSFSATIPPMPNATTVIYYVLSSTVTPAGGLNGGNADALTLNLDSNSGSNYSYSVSPMPWPGGATAGYPSDPATNIHHWKEEAIVGNQYMTVQLDQNGNTYDIYYPSVGDRHGVSTSNEGYRGPEEFPSCPSLDQEANGQMNLVAAMGGIGTFEGGTNSIHWLQNTSGDYSTVGQQYVPDNNVVCTTNLFTAGGNNILIQQYDFCPTTNALPVVTDGTRTNYGVYVKRFLLTNLQVTTNTIDFYFDANFNINGGNQYDGMYWETNAVGTNYNAMIAFDNTSRSVPVQTNSCDPNGYTTEYSPAFAFPWQKSSSIYFGTVMKLVTNSATGAGTMADGSWRDHTSADNQEGWIGKRVILPPGQPTEVDVMIVGSWDDFAGATGTHNFWGRPMIDWFYSSNVSNVQATTEAYWSNWLGSGVTAILPGAQYNTLFNRSLLVTALHIDAKTGAIIAGMHNGAYPFVWPRDGVYAAITLDRTGHTNEAAAFYKWCRDVAFRDTDCVDGGLGFFYQKYTTDGYKVWTSPQLDETASVPWGLYYHYLATGDGGFLTNYWNLAFQCANASSETSCSNALVFFDGSSDLMNSYNVWEDTLGEHIYSNASIVRGLRDAANIATYVGSNSWATTFLNRADLIVTGIVARMNFRVEPADISHLGITVPYEVLTPADPRMTNAVEWINGRVSAGTCGACSGGPYTDNLVENDSVNYPGIVGLVNRYAHNENGSTDNYWNTSLNSYLHSPWFLATSWYGEYYTRWQDYVGGTSLVDTNKYLLDLLINKLGPMGLASEQIAPTTALQKYPGFWLQTAWPNVWESHSTLIDQMMMFLDYRPTGTNGNNTGSFAPKLPSAWSTMTFDNLNSQGQHFDITITENATNVRADLNKRTTGALNYDIYLRLPPSTTPVMVVTNGAYYVPSPSDYNTTTGRVHVHGPLTTSAIGNSIVVTYGNNSYTGDGIPDYWALQYAFNPLDPSVANADSDGDGLSNLQEFLAGTDPTNSASSLRITSITRTGNVNIITWESVNGKTYHLQSTDTLTGTFTDLAGPDITASGSSTFTTDTTAVVGRFYRVHLVLP
jgi:GH15 family glucan-1,4-alpha-glucosidase